jgi:hypothetical protein
MEEGRGTFAEDGLPLLVGFLDWIRHLFGTIGTEETAKEWNGRHRLENTAPCNWLYGFERCLCGSFGGVVAYCVESADDGGESWNAHREGILIVYIGPSTQCEYGIVGNVFGLEYLSGTVRVA